MQARALFQVLSSNFMASCWKHVLAEVRKEENMILALHSERQLLEK
jgi:hypothetical protein